MKKENIIKYTIGIPFLIGNAIYYLYCFMNLLVNSDMCCYYYYNKLKKLLKPFN